MLERQAHTPFASHANIYHQIHFSLLLKMFPDFE